MSLPIAVVVFLLGLVLIVVAIIGGGLEIKEIKIPILSSISRTMSAAFGFLLVAASFFPAFLPGNNPPASPSVAPPPPSPSPPSLSSVSSSPVGPSPTSPSPPAISYQAIPIHYVENQRAFARSLRSYLESIGYAVSATEDDFSQIPQSEHEPAGTVRVVYKTSVAPIEQKIVGAIRSKFPHTTNVAERLNNGASVDLQIELW